MSMTVCIRIKHNSMSRAKGQRHHDMRFPNRIPRYVDHTKSNFNSVIIEPLKEAAIAEICAERQTLKPRIRRPKTTSSICTNFIITFGKEAQPSIEALSYEQQNDLFRRTGEAIARELDTDLTGLVVHRDESAIHAHGQMPSWNKKGQAIAKVSHRAKMRALQDRAGQIYEQLNITRGKPKIQRIQDGEPYYRYIHQSVYQLHERLPIEIAELQAQIEENKQLEKALQDHLDTLKKRVSDNEDTIQQALKTLRNYNQQIKNAKNELKLKPLPKKMEIQQVVELKKRILGPSKPILKKIDVYDAKQIDAYIKPKLAKLERERQRLTRLEQSLTERIEILNRRDKKLRGYEKIIEEYHQAQSENDEELNEIPTIDEMEDLMTPKNHSKSDKNKLIP